MLLHTSGSIIQTSHQTHQMPAETQYDKDITRTVAQPSLSL